MHTLQSLMELPGVLTPIQQIHGISVRAVADGHSVQMYDKYEKITVNVHDVCQVGRMWIAYAEDGVAISTDAEYRVYRTEEL